MRKLLALFIACAFLAGTAGISLAADPAVDSSKVGSEKTTTKKEKTETKGKKKTKVKAKPKQKAKPKKKKKPAAAAPKAEAPKTAAKD